MQIKAKTVTLSQSATASVICLFRNVTESLVHMIVISDRLGNLDLSPSLISKKSSDLLQLVTPVCCITQRHTIKTIVWIRLMIAVLIFSVFLPNVYPCKSARHLTWDFANSMQAMKRSPERRSMSRTVLQPVIAEPWCMQHRHQHLEAKAIVLFCARGKRYVFLARGTFSLLRMWGPM